MDGTPQHSDGAPDFGRPVSMGSRVPASPRLPESTDEDSARFAPFVLNVLAGRQGPIPGPDQVPVVADLFRLHRLAGLAYTWALRAGPEADLLAQALESTYRRQQLAGTMVQESAERALRALASAGIPALVFKGAALVRSGIYEDCGERPMDDADLLVRPEQAQTAVRALEAEGFSPWQPWKQGRERWSDAFTLRDTTVPSAFPCDIDLHWRTEYGSLRFGSGGSPLWDASDSERTTPAPESHLLVVAEHFLKHLRVRPHLLAYADIGRLCRAVGSWDAFERLASGRWWSPAVGLVLDVMRADLDAPVPQAVIQHLVAGRPGIRKAVHLVRPSAYVGRGVSAETRVSGMGQRWRLGPGPAGAFKELVGTAFPPGTWLRSRYGSGSRITLQLRHGLALLGWASGSGTSPLSPNQESPDPPPPQAERRGSGSR